MWGGDGCAKRASARARQVLREEVGSRVGGTMGVGWKTRGQVDVCIQ